MAMVADGLSVTLLVMLALVLQFAGSGAQLTPRNITVGGKLGWQYGVNYTTWAQKNAPFFMGDALVFYYHNKTIGNVSIPHSVLISEDYQLVSSCNFSKAIQVGNITQGIKGFRFNLTDSKQYNFACGIGPHCKLGNMRFAVFALEPHNGV
ncbi:hypothetical protein O6H91_01G080200 [Diphasiastrum complanatum]|uniref:Uncharacterized protein n=1 Tax=Diphasiastrum complanatum TaxID=34168 RepID=A0ACC2ESV4_DIPCM|nr:hypothetical protein O6H91_01G080200 [Diphasiastrum complanatum]